MLPLVGSSPSIVRRFIPVIAFLMFSAPGIDVEAVSPGLVLRRSYSIRSSTLRREAMTYFEADFSNFGFGSKTTSSYLL
jgi:hypothetical protein